MRHLLRFTLAFLLWTSCNPASMTYDQYPTYDGTDLGVNYAPEATTWKVWSPAVDSLRLHLYRTGHLDDRLDTHPLVLDPATGVWSITLDGDWTGHYYTVQAYHEGDWLAEVPDPYARATGVNGARGMVLDLATTDPEGWAADVRPPLASLSDVILYELHIRDLSAHPNSGITHARQYLGLTETATRNAAQQSTGLDHIRELGVTHVHLLPVFDFMPRSVDERDPASRYNWGYDPQNYNVPEGAYATDPYDGAVRIREFKQMVQALHRAGLRVVMDVVYNHTGVTEASHFNQVAPGYYYRHLPDGSFSNASACGNETASERPMMRKFMLESMRYWVEEYHVDGFRVDLMGIHDINTMNAIAADLKSIDSTLLLYGEGWTAGDSPLPYEQRALKAHGKALHGVGLFSDDMRDGLKGSVFEHAERGFVSGAAGLEESIKFGVVAATDHPQVDTTRVKYAKAFWSPSPQQTINYVSCHDNHTLWDKLLLSNPDADEATRLQMHRLAHAIVFTSQGIPFMHAGAELARTKSGVENSFEHPDSINRLDWSRKSQYAAHHAYFQALIALRKAHPAFRLHSAKAIQDYLYFVPNTPPGIVAYRINGAAVGDDWPTIWVVYNATREAWTLPFGESQYAVHWEGDVYDLAAPLSQAATLRAAPLGMTIARAVK